MKNTFLKLIGNAALGILMLAAFAPVSVSAQDIINEEKSDWQEEQGERNNRSIIGAWRTAVTQRNCQTGLPLGAANRGLITFNEGGTLAESNTPGSNPASSRSLGHGIWERRNGRRNYSFVFVIHRYDASGALISYQKIRAALELSANGDGYTNNAAIEVFDAGDNLIGTGCATGVGTRIE